VIARACFLFYYAPPLLLPRAARLRRSFSCQEGRLLPSSFLVVCCLPPSLATQGARGDSFSVSSAMRRGRPCAGKSSAAAFCFSCLCHSVSSLSTLSLSFTLFLYLSLSLSFSLSPSLSLSLNPCISRFLYPSLAIYLSLSRSLLLSFSLAGGELHGR
jgi:hypothetical protein